MTPAERRRWATAYHEAGHAVVGYFLHTMRGSFRRATVIETDDALGYVLRRQSRAFYRRMAAGDWTPHTEVRAYELLMCTMAGTLAEKRFTGRRNRRGAGWNGTPFVERGSDLDTVGDFVLRLAGTDADEQRALVRWLTRRTENMLMCRWKAVEAVAAALVAQGTIEGRDALGAVVAEAYGLRPLALTGAISGSAVSPASVPSVSPGRPCRPDPASRCASRGDGGPARATDRRRPART